MGTYGRTAYGTEDLSSDGKEIRIGSLLGRNQDWARFVIYMLYVYLLYSTRCDMDTIRNGKVLKALSISVSILLIVLSTPSTYGFYKSINSGKEN